MRFVIDTYNLLHVSAARGGVAPRSVHDLCRAIAASPQSMNTTLVLDGRAKPDEPSPNEFPAITLVYSGAGVPADTVIGQIVERSPHRKKITVVTDDRAVALNAKRLFANALSCDAFLERLFTSHPLAPRALPARKTQGSPTSGETAHWLAEFGITPLPPPPPPPGADDDDDLDIERLLGPRG